ncbi:MAG: hypothetical protein ACM3PY_08625 [Omnitrophica WOR_2 bacterium]
MTPLKSSRKGRACLYIPLGFVLLCLLAIAASALSNLGLPQHSSTIERLNDLEKARLSEVIHLRADLGDAAWPGWSQADIPLIVYNEQYAFLVGYADPPAGWKKVPSLEVRGGPWEEVPGDTFEGHPYYRNEITSPQKTPEGFTVLVGERWAATFQTREYSQIQFMRDFRQQLPPLISSLVPVRLVWALLMGKTDAYIGTLEHESFHAYEGISAASRLEAAEHSFSVERFYPFDALEKPWKQEMEILLEAAQAGSRTEASDLARQFLQLRSSRRSGLSAEQVDYERLREWEEGLAKYAELEITRQAGANPDYHPVQGILQDTNFKNYQGQQLWWSSQLKEAKNVQGRSGDTRFYYSGNALAVVLDRLLPGWKPRALPGGEYLDDLLGEAVK